jgi:predicted nucleotidyltransferase
MVKTAINISSEQVNNVIYDLHHTLKKHGIEDNRIALFGSFNEGIPHEDSDIDIIIISNLFENKDIFERIEITMKAENEIMKKHCVPMDVMLKTPQEYNNDYFKSAIVI